MTELHKDKPTMEGFKEAPNRHRHHISVLIVTRTSGRGLIPLITNIFHKDLYLDFFFMPLIYSMKIITFGILLPWVRKKNRKKRDLWSLFFLRLAWLPKSFISITIQTQIILVRIATNGCSLISDFSQKMPTNNPQMALPEQVSFFFLFSGNI